LIHSWTCITEIDYLHIDTQGNDFRVLQSLGDKISCVKEGAAEASQNAKYYAVEDNTVDIVSSWLIDKGFYLKVLDDGIGKEHTGACPNGNEANIYFKR
jgi:hypothetical protein